ncbi:hypothetical protein C7459_103121 [Tumebacillus permanentifrigoris]|uniref:Uncharacterized protein n=1 Tax=Tumebacillus permanentifrigoris TaxID=378543 RepID=A0A316DC64_9BACL|nr:hypothetical protein C7459_103121 [Tumebacillus permanentifrigoris]
MIYHSTLYKKGYSMPSGILYPFARLHNTNSREQLE